MTNHETISTGALWTGRVIKWLCVAFLVFDAGMKLIKHPKSVEGTVQFGLPVSYVQPLGIYLMSATILYIIPKTAMLGCLMLVAYLGAATAIMMRSQLAGHPYLFPIIFAVVALVGEYLQNMQLRQLLPFASS